MRLLLLILALFFLRTNGFTQNSVADNASLIIPLTELQNSSSESDSLRILSDIKRLIKSIDYKENFYIEICVIDSKNRSVIHSLANWILLEYPDLKNRLLLSHGNRNCAYQYSGSDICLTVLYTSTSE